MDTSQKKSILLLVVSVITLVEVCGQSLKNIQEKSTLIQQDTNQVDMLLKQAGFYYFSNPDSCLMFASQALELARKMRNTKREIAALHIAGEALRFHGDYPTSLEYQFQALELSLAIKSRLDEAHSLNFIGFNYSRLGEGKQALRYLFKAQEIYEQSNQTERKGLNLSNIGEAYTGLGQLDSALFFLDQALVIAETIGHQNLIALTLTRQGFVRYQQGEYEQALKLYHRDLRVARGNKKDRINPARIQRLIAQLHLKLGQTDSCLYYSRNALNEANRSAMQEEMLLAANLLVSAYRDRQMEDSLIYYQSLVLSLKDSLFGPDKFRQLQVLALRQQERQLEIVREQEAFRNRSRMLTLSGILLFVVVLAVIMYRNYRHKHKSNLVLEEQKLKLENTLSELKATQSQLIQSEKMASLGELTAGIAHEIQNPLNFVNNFSEINTELIDDLEQEVTRGSIEQAVAIAKSIKENEQKIVHHGKRADAIVKGMLQHSRSSNGVKEATDINALADEYFRLAYHGIRAKDKTFNASMKSDFDESIGSINIISQDIGRVILNLITNAFYAVAEKKKQQPDDYEPTVTVSTKKNGDKIFIVVKDNGNGIPSGILDKIFQPFFTTKPTGRGTGLGLSLSYDIIKAHGGEINVKTKEGEFTEFVIQLPETSA